MFICKISWGGKLIAGVHTPFYDSDDFAKYCDSLHIKASEYINSGILLMNCNLMRSMDLNKEFMRHLGQNYYYQDQDILNIVCKGKIAYLPLDFNYPSYLFRATENKPAIIHYSGPKPWKVFTNLWAYWWGVYEKSVVYDAAYEEKMYKKILIPDYSFKQIARLFCRHLKNLLK